MALFEVPGWSVPSGAPLNTSQPSKKRKRSTGDDLNKMQSAEVNLDKLMKKLDGGAGRGDSLHGTKRSEKKGKTVKGKGKSESVKDDRVQGKRKGVLVTDEGRKNVKNYPPKAAPNLTSEDSPSSHSTKKRKNKDSKALDESLPTSTTITPKANTPTKAPGLTPMQKGMKDSLDGARFRWINEVLYKTDSARAHQMMQDDPKVYEEYHTGFRHQVHLWPTNPVSHYIHTLSSYPPRTVIADLGCGDAALARELLPKEMIVLSFDLVSDGAFVVEADICGKIPLPGSEFGVEGSTEGEGHVVDVVVCALSLMGTNWVNCIREAWRILKPGGELKIAEVASRFSEIDEFTSLISSVGFRLKSKDDSNTHFTLFEFEKIARKPKLEKEWAKIISKGNILKPCEYKRR